MLFATSLIEQFGFFLIGLAMLIAMIPKGVAKKGAHVGFMALLRALFGK